MDIEITSICLLDDGTLDTVIYVCGNKGSRTYRYNIEFEQDDNREAICKGLAEEDYYNEFSQ